MFAFVLAFAVFEVSRPIPEILLFPLELTLASLVVGQKPLFLSLKSRNALFRFALQVFALARLIFALLPLSHCISLDLSVIFSEFFISAEIFCATASHFFICFLKCL